jgi:hypothetical protein
MLDNPETSVDALLASARSYLKELSESSKPPIKAALPAVSFWLEKRNFLEAVEELVQITDVCQIEPNSRVAIQVEFTVSNTVYRLVIKTVVNENGVFSLRHSELIDVDYPYSEKDLWNIVKDYAKENSLAIAGLVLSLFNASLNVMRLFSH